MRGDLYGKGNDHVRRPQDGNLTPSYTPGSASILQPGAALINRNCNNGNGGQPSYQRQGSNESGKGSYSSDKDMGGDGSNGFCNGVGGGGGAISVANPVALHRYLSCASRLLFLFYLFSSVFILNIYSRALRFVTYTHTLTHTPNTKRSIKLALYSVLLSCAVFSFRANSLFRFYG